MGSIKSQYNRGTACANGNCGGSCGGSCGGAFASPMYGGFSQAPLMPPMPFPQYSQYSQCPYNNFSSIGYYSGTLFGYGYGF